MSLPEDIRHAIYAESGHDFSGDVCPGATIDNLDSGAIEIFRSKWVGYSGNRRIANLTAQQLLTDCAAISDDGVTYAALVLFGKNSALIKYLPHSEIVFEYRSMESAGPAAHRVDFREGFFNSFDRIWELINLRNDQQHYQERFAVLPVYTFNERAVREAILNAVSHRNYQLAGNIFVRQYSRRIVIENPGGFPAGITIDNILDKQSARNNRIASIFQLCGLVERAGQGMNLMYELAVREAKPLPDFNGSDAYSVKLTLNGQVFDPYMLALIKKLNEELLEAMTTDDYVLLSMFFYRKRYAEIHRSRFEHLAELGLVELTENRIELVNSGRILLTDNNGNHIVDNGVLAASYANNTNYTSSSDSQATAKRLPSDSQAAAKRQPSDCRALEASDRKKQIVEFIASNGKATSSQLAMLTGLTQGRIRRMLNKLAADGAIAKIGDNRYASYVLKE